MDLNPPFWRWVCILSLLSLFTSFKLVESASSDGDSIKSLLASLPELAIFNRALLKSKVGNYLGPGNLSRMVFAPNNAAFEKVINASLLTCVDYYFLAHPCTSVHDILRATNVDKIVLNHILNGKFEVDAHGNGTRVRCLGDAVVEVETEGKRIYVGNALVASKYTARDGILYVIDNVLGSKDPTTMLSTDVSLNETVVLGATKLSDADVFNLVEMQEMAEGAQLFNIPGFQRNRNLVGYKDGGLYNPPALTFDPTLNDPTLHNECMGSMPDKKFKYPVLHNVTRPANDEDLAFMTVLELGALIRTKQVTSQELVQLYTNRLQRYDQWLKAVITYTTELANEQALAADALLEKGIYLGPLHGIPYGLKDIMAVPKYKTTWGSRTFKDQVINKEAWVYKRLKAAGAVLIAKLVAGSLAYDDIWFGGQTKNPWNIAEGSTGSSAGSAVSTSAGNVPFALGSETAGSITYPAARTGVTAIRPSFGMVGRSWVMSLSASMDKLGSFCRSAADCAIILDIIGGRDPNDISSKDIQLKDPFQVDITKLVVGYLPDADMEVVRVLGSKGVKMVKFDLNYTVNSAQDMINFVMDVDMLANFDHWQRSGLDDEYEAQWQWPLETRRARLISAVDYVQTQRVRGILQREVLKCLKEQKIDAFIGNATDWEKVSVGNLIGIPVMVVPTGLKNITNPPPKGTNRKTTINTGIYAGLYRDGEVLALAMAYQQETTHHLARPPINNVGPGDPLPVARVLRRKKNFP
ncbi:unnamed protein product [Calypogeia fissa]